MQKNDLPLISVIVPVYNVEAYIDKCIDTLCKQSYKNYEIILIDDGSTDGSGKKCDGYRDKHIKVFHKKNSGLSDTRNYGVKKSKGEYIVFVDSDDYVSEEYLEDLYKMVCTYQVDVAVMRLCAVRENKPISLKTDLDVLTCSRCLNTEQALSEMLYCKWGVTACSKIYSRYLVERYPYPPGCFYEDLATTYKIIACCEKVAVSDKFDYAYLQRSNSIMHRKVTDKELFGLTAAKEQMLFIKQHYPNIYLAAQHRYAVKIIQYMPCIIENTPEQKEIYKMLRMELKPYYLSIIRDRKVKIIKKICFTAMMAGYVPSIILWKMIAILKRLN